jgi:hypothetical protein
MSRDQIFAIVATIAVLTGLALGFRELGPPRVQRAENADLARGRDLESISRAIDFFYRLNHRLPGTLDELKKTNPGLQLNDPETRALYAYRPQGDTQYQLCANFAGDNRTDPAPPGTMAHPAGTYCTSYVVNKPLY